MNGLINASNFVKGLFVAGCGILGVFLVLLLFFVFIKVAVKVLPPKEAQRDENSQ